MLSKWRAILALAMLSLVTGCASGKYSGGSGEQDAPYRIATAEDLLAMAADTNDYGAHFVLTADIDLGPNLPGRKIFRTAVIAHNTNNATRDFQGTAFTGVFDGADHKIINLAIDTGGTRTDYLGLFGCISGGKVKNLGVENVRITSGPDTSCLGGLAGYNDKGDISDCFSTGTVAGGNNADLVGGLVGDNCFGSVNNCFSICAVTTGDGSTNVGGLAGGNAGTIRSCYSTGTIRVGTISIWLGELAGSNNGTIGNCCSTAKITSGMYSYNIGGLVGDNANGTIINCYSAAIEPITHGIFRYILACK